jgi:hypothetical protein
MSKVFTLVCLMACFCFQKTDSFKGCGFVQFAGNPNTAAAALCKATAKNGDRIRGRPVRHYLAFFTPTYSDFK